MQRLLKSSKFWTGVVAFVTNVALLFVRTFAPESEPFVNELMVSVTVLAGIIIAAIAAEDVAQKATGG